MTTPSTVTVADVARVRPRRRAGTSRSWPPPCLFVVMYGVGGDPATTGSPTRRSPQPVHRQRFLLVVAVGMTFVILTGGIDLSVGSVVALHHDDRGDAAARPGWPPLRRACRWCWSSARLLGLADGLRHPLLRDPAVHRHARRDVPGPRPVLRDQHRVDPDQRPASARSWRQTQDPPRRRTSLSIERDHRAGRRARRGLRAALHPVRAQRLRHRRQRAVGPADGPAGGPHEDRASTRSAASARRSAACCSPSTSPSGYGAARASAWSSTRSPPSSSAAPC